MKQLFTWQQKLSILQALDIETLITMWTGHCCWKQSAVKTPPAVITALLPPIYYSLSMLCVYTFSGEDNMGFFFPLWEMSSKNLRFAKCTWKGLKNVSTPAASWCWQQFTDPRGGLSDGRNGHRSCTNGSRESSRRLCLSHVLPTREHSALKLRAHENWNNFR